IKTILESILGGNVSVKVMASVGHIIDLAANSMSVDIVGGNFEPRYETMGGKGEVVSKLKKAAGEADDILIATDKDREGEMIAWSLVHVLKLKKVKRISFVAVTKSELTKAVNNPGEIDYDLVNAQKARRILDRIVGYEVSPLLWKRVGNGGGGLSAGRVQSVVVRIIVDRENEIVDFFKKGADSYFKFDGMFVDLKGKVFGAQLYCAGEQVGEKNESEDEEEGLCPQKGVRAKIKLEADANALMKLLKGSKYKIGNVSEKERVQKPSAPFTTSTIQQEAARKLGMTVKRTMTAAQHLYEAGHITYMRTDSVNLSLEALENIKKYVVGKYGVGNHCETNYKSKSANTQEAHEAIRPTDVFTEVVEEDGKIGVDETRLYGLIWKRAVASQMIAAKFRVTTVQIVISKVTEYYFVTVIENVSVLGFLAVYNFEEKEANVNISLPEVGGNVDIEQIGGVQEYQRPKPRYNEASLVNKLDPKNLNIGRPSTTGAIIQKIQEREYVKMGNVCGYEKDVVSLVWKGGEIEKTVKKILIGKENGRLIPTDLGVRVNTFLIESFPEIMDYKFTAKMEQELDDVAEGNGDWVKVLDGFYKKFHPIVEKIKGEEVCAIGKGDKLLGVHPVNGQSIYSAVGKYGAIVKMCPEKGKAVIAPVREPLTLESVSLDDAVKLFEYPKNLGKHGRKQVIVKRGKFGLYVVCGDCTVNLSGVDDDPENITLERACELIKKKESAVLYQVKDGVNSYSVLRGPYGVYVKFDNGKKKTNLKISQDIDVEALTLETLKGAIKDGKKRFPKKKVEPAPAAPAKKVDAPAKKPRKKIVVKGKKPKKVAAKDRVVNLFEV
ncbi:MAG: DNA topoisomerase IA, partial [Hyperionvirus sp.]